jgi:hypothetical protein
MEYSTFQINYGDLDVDLSQIENVLGYGEGDDRVIVNSVIEEILKEPQLFRNIRAEYRIFDDIEFMASDKSISIGGINFRVNKILYGQLRNSDSLALFLCTAGAEPGIRTRSAMTDGDPLTAYIYDLIGSIVVDAATDLLQSELEHKIVSARKKITNRYSPGYCGWDVSEQHKLFRLFPDNFCGITLTDSALMDPVKSISGLIGIGETVKFNKYTCSLCELKECSFRVVSERKSKKYSV